ncbi:MAG: segregation/condensation protein A [Lachnospiraceae bacterium]|nr:segregation/condensation protein A [Lachnospiraceae bacterium]
MELSVKLEVFEGPLDLLLHLLEKNKVNIYDIPIVEITNQYLEYIREMQRQDLNVMSEFLVMAATLIDIKSRMLLPKQETVEEEEDPRDELVRQLLEYKMYKMMSYELRERQELAEKTYYKLPTIPDEVASYEEPVDMEELLGDLTMEKLNNIFNMVLLRQENKIDRTRASFGDIPQEEISLDDKLVYLEDFAKVHKKFGFRSLLEKQGSKMEIIVCFLAVLEMMKAGKITISQNNLFDEIMVESKIA